MSEKTGGNPPKLWHVGIVVRDLEKAIEYYSKFLGMGPFESGPSLVTKKQLVKGKPYSGTLVKGAAVEIGPFMVELLEPVGDGPHKWFLDSQGEGIHHLGFMVDDCDAWLEYAKKQGIEILIESEMELPGAGGAHIVYLQADKPGSVVVELTEFRSPS